MRVPVFILFMAMTMGLYAQKYKVGTTTALWKVPASTDFSQARSVGVAVSYTHPEPTRP